MTRCAAVGALMVGGKVVGRLQCELDDGHSNHIERDGKGGWRPYPSPHRFTLEWEGETLPEFDPWDEPDVDVPL